jgi:hypothetical protein
MTARHAAAQQRPTVQAQPSAAEAAAHRRDMRSLRQRVAAECAQAKALRKQYMARRVAKK